MVRQVRSPSVLMPPEGIRLPGRTSAGIGSPVMAERSTNPPPSSTSQSIGTRSPGLSRIVLPGATDSAGTFCWDPSGSRRTAVSGRCWSAPRYPAGFWRPPAPREHFRDGKRR